MGIQFHFSISDQGIQLQFSSTDMGINYQFSISDTGIQFQFSISDTGIQFRFSICDEVDHMIDTEYHRPLEFLDISHQRLAEQLTYKDAVMRIYF